MCVFYYYQCDLSMSMVARLTLEEMELPVLKHCSSSAADRTEGCCSGHSLTVHRICLALEWTTTWSAARVAGKGKFASMFQLN